MFEITPQLIVSLLAPILSAIGVVFYAGRWVSALNNRLDAIDNRIQMIGTQVARLTTYTGGLSKESVQQFALVVQMLNKRGDLSTDELKLILAQQARVNEVAVDAFMAQERAALNPLTAEQYQRLEDYVSKARRGEFFSAQEVQDYNTLIAIIEREDAENPGVWALAALGAFLLGIAIASRNREHNS